MKKLNEIVQQSQLAFSEWKNIPFEEKQRYLAKATKILLEKIDDFSIIITKEMNKPISQSKAEIEKCASLLEYYSSCENFIVSEIIKTKHTSNEIHHEPMGIILGIMPWNFPFWQVLRFAIPAVLSGNAVIIKHASICTESGKAIQKIFEKSNFPKNLFTSIEVSHQEIEDLIANPFIKAISVTGGEITGKKIAEIAGKNIKKCVLELGGNDAFIVLEDANIIDTAKQAALARLQNCGQTCIAAKRFIVHDKIYNYFIEKFVEEYKKFVPKDPNNSSTILGFMAKADLANDLYKQYEKALKYGAKVIIPLEIKNEIEVKPGMIEVNEDNPILQEELFGPLAIILKAKTDEDALRIANNTFYGLGNSIWSSNKEKAIYFAKNLESGTVAINQILRSDPKLPFSGTKNSGYGTELSKYALLEFTYRKTIMGL